MFWILYDSTHVPFHAPLLAHFLAHMHSYSRYRRFCSLESLDLRCVFILLQLKTAREAAAFGATGAALGAVSTAAFAWKYSKSPHGKDSFSLCE